MPSSMAREGWSCSVAGEFGTTVQIGESGPVGAVLVEAWLCDVTASEI